MHEFFWWRVKKSSSKLKTKMSNLNMHYIIRKKSPFLYLSDIQAGNFINSFMSWLIEPMKFAEEANIFLFYTRFYQQAAIFIPQLPSNLSSSSSSFSWTCLISFFQQNRFACKYWRWVTRSDAIIIEGFPNPPKIPKKLFGSENLSFSPPWLHHHYIRLLYWKCRKFSFTHPVLMIMCTVLYSSWWMSTH